MIQDNGTTASVSVRHGAKVNRGNYQSEEASAGFSIEFDLEGVTFAEALAELVQLESQLIVVAQQQAALALGAEVGTDGIVFSAPPAPVATATALAASGGGGGGKPDYPAPIVAAEDKQQIIIDGRAYYDQRGLKLPGPNGEAPKYKPGAADFRAVDQDAAPDGRKQLWITTKAGAIVPETQAMLAAVGITV